jgi:hypothetical protein
MQVDVHVGDLRLGYPERLAETGGEFFRLFAPAFETRPMTSGERRDLVEKNRFVQPGPPPRVLRPKTSRLRPRKSQSQMIQALVAQRRFSKVLGGIVDRAAIAGEQAARRCNMNLAERIDAILQWHSSLSFQ